MEDHGLELCQAELKLCELQISLKRTQFRRAQIKCELDQLDETEKDIFEKTKEAKARIVELGEKK